MHETSMNYCSHCGKSTLSWDGEKEWKCTECDFVLYHNCAAAVAVLLWSEDKILFTRRNKNPGKNLLDLPGGFVDPNESAQEAAQREIMEELSVSIDPSQLHIIDSLPNKYPYKGIVYNTLDLFLEYRLSDLPKVSLQETEISEVCWLGLDELAIEDLAFESQKIFFKRLKKRF